MQGKARQACGRKDVPTCAAATAPVLPPSLQLSSVACVYFQVSDLC